MVYSRIKNNIVYCTVEDIYTIDITADDFWISHDNLTDFAVGDKYPVHNIQQEKATSKWGATSMDSEPLNFLANTV
jgi:hypothetical protein